MMQKQDLWGLASDDSGTPVECKFEDSFSPECTSPWGEEEESLTDEDYVPLEDSSQYLAGLERKLARIQGRTASRRQAESRRLIDALASSRETHAHQLINTDTLSTDEVIPSEIEHGHQVAAVDPQGALGAMLRRLAPDRVALTHEELCQLLEADFLAKIQEAAAEEEEANKRISAENRTNQANFEDKMENDQTKEYVDAQEEKKLSSDEGEK